jgi:transposase
MDFLLLADNRGRIVIEVGGRQYYSDVEYSASCLVGNGSPARDLQIGNMTRSARGTRDNPGRNVSQKAGLNRGILRSGWGLLVRRLEEKAPGRVEKIKPAFTSQRCSACGQVDRDSR